MPALFDISRQSPTAIQQHPRPRAELDGGGSVTPNGFSASIAPPGSAPASTKNTVEYSIFCGEWCIGRIYETRTGPEVSALVLGAARSQQTGNPTQLKSGRDP
jgi:hypothetical protein